MFSYFNFLHILDATTHSKDKASNTKTTLAVITNTMIIIITSLVSIGEEVEVKESEGETEDDGDGDNKDDNVDVGLVAIVTRDVYYKLTLF